MEQSIKNKKQKRLIEKRRRDALFIREEFNLMGGRGASIGKSYVFRGKERVYGSEYKTMFQVDNIKFISQNDKTISTTAPRETITKGRVYVTINTDLNKSEYITYYSDDGKKSKSIDLLHKHKGMDIHVQEGYSHEIEARDTTDKENRMVERVNKLWHDYISK